MVILLQFFNKLRYAKEGARDIMDRTCADLPWQVWLEVDGRDIEIPKVNYRLIIIFRLMLVIYVVGTVFSKFICKASTALFLNFSCRIRRA